MRARSARAQSLHYHRHRYIVLHRIKKNSKKCTHTSSTTSETHVHYTQNETSVEDSASKVSSKVYTIAIKDSSNQERIQLVYTNNNSSSSKLVDYEQQDYLLVLEEINEDVVIEPLQVTPEGPPSLEIPLTILGDKALLTED